MASADQCTDAHVGQQTDPDAGHNEHAAGEAIIVKVLVRGLTSLRRVRKPEVWCAGTSGRFNWNPSPAAKCERRQIPHLTCLKPSRRTHCRTAAIREQANRSLLIAKPGRLDATAR